MSISKKIIAFLIFSHTIKRQKKTFNRFIAGVSLMTEVLETKLEMKSYKY